MEKLAIFGGQPIRKEKIFYGKQWVTEEDAKAVTDTLLSNFITCGPKVSELERKLENYTGAKHAVVCANGTAALHIACLAAGIKSGDEVITTPITFAASANCALYCGARPVFADIDINTYNIDPLSIEKCITDKTKAVVAVDFTGQVVDLERIKEICKKHKIILIEDAAHSIGTKYDGKMVGSIADITTFSFHPVKTITAGEVGAILTNDEELYKKIYLYGKHGITHEESEMRNPVEGVWYYEQIYLGYNYRMTDFQAALLLSQLKRIDQFIARRKEIVKRYNEAFSEMPEIIIQKEIEQSDTCRHLYIIRLNLDRLKCTRKEFFDAMSAENVQCQVHYIPVYWFPYYENLGYKRGLCSNAEKLYNEIMSIPLYPRLTDEEVEDTIKAVKKIVEYYKK